MIYQQTNRVVTLTLNRPDERNAMAVRMLNTGDFTRADNPLWSCAAALTFTGDMIDAAQALFIGLVSHVVPHEELMSSTLALS